MQSSTAGSAGNYGYCITSVCCWGGEQWGSQRKGERGTHRLFRPNIHSSKPQERDHASPSHTSLAVSLHCCVITLHAERGVSSMAAWCGRGSAPVSREDAVTELRMPSVWRRCGFSASTRSGRDQIPAVRPSQRYPSRHVPSLLLPRRAEGVQDRIDLVLGAEAPTSSQRGHGRY